MINCLLLILIFHLFSCRNVTIPSASALVELFEHILIPADRYLKDLECLDVVKYTVKVASDGFTVESLKTLLNKNRSYFICEFNFDFDLYGSNNLQIFSHWHCEADYDAKCNVYMSYR